MYEGKMWGVEERRLLRVGRISRSNAKQGANVTEANHPPATDETRVMVFCIGFQVLILSDWDGKEETGIDRRSLLPLLQSTPVCDPTWSRSPKGQILQVAVSLAPTFFRGPGPF